VDSLHLLQAIGRWASENGRVVDVLLELHLGAEESKQGFTEEEILKVVESFRSEATAPSGARPGRVFADRQIRKGNRPRGMKGQSPWH
jgi:hypothetical protein